MMTGERLEKAKKLQLIINLMGGRCVLSWYLEV